VFTIILQSGLLRSQIVADFENFSLPPDSFYYSPTAKSFTTINGYFRHDTSMGYWSGGFAYTNIHDVVNGNYHHLYNCDAINGAPFNGFGYNNSNYYVTGQDGGIIKLKSPSNRVQGFFITNTMYAYAAMKYGNGFSRKFGDTTGTKSGLPQGTYPDWFKITVKGYLGGVVKTDSVEFYLADYRFSNDSLDYIVKSWQYVSADTLGNVDSIQFHMYSSDVSQYGINTPAFFSIDNFVTLAGVGIEQLNMDNQFLVYPNPAASLLNLKILDSKDTWNEMKLVNSVGLILKQVKFDEGIQDYQMDLSDLGQGLYFLEFTSSNKRKTMKIVHQ
jgi:hypothetical protein